MRRHEALAVLGLPTTADARTVRRRFRELARTEHPDRGGDPDAFARLREAYAVVRTASAPTRPTVARGRPSRSERPVTPAVSGTAAADVTGGDAARLAEQLGAVLAPDGRPARLRLVSVAPGARRNRLATALPEASLAVLELAVGPGRAAVVLTVRTRSARRAVARLALDRPDLPGSWTRHRGDAALELRAQLRMTAATPQERATAAATVAAGLLAALSWPVAEWMADRGR